MHAFSQYIHDMISGPGSFRFLVQPLVAILLGIRDGRLDSHAGAPMPTLRNALRRIAVPMCVAAALSLVFQFVILKEVRLLPAIAFSVVLVALPYMIARASSQRADTRWHRTHPRS